MSGTRAGQPVTVGSVRLIPLEKLRIRCGSRDGALFTYASKEPVGLVICSGHDSRAVNIEGEPVPLETWLQEVPELQRLVTP